MGVDMQTSIVLALTTTLALVSGQASTPGLTQCSMTQAFTQSDKNGGKTPRFTNVWADDQKVMLFADTMNVNTDGTLRSYSVDDYWGETAALNNLCNASQDSCDGLTSDQKRLRRIATQDAKAKGWPASAMPALKMNPDITPFRDGKPCPEVNGFLVSATSLQKPNSKDVCDISNYVDSLTVNAVVLPRGPRPDPKKPREQSDFQKRGAEVGDLAVAVSANGTIQALAVVGDTGPATELGEVSIGLAKVLLRKTTLPANYLEVRGYRMVNGKKMAVPGLAWTPGKTFILVFPKTRNAGAPYMDQARIDAEAKKSFDAWGGADRIKACMAGYVSR